VTTKEVLQAWGTILAGRKPSLSIEITKECPLRCPGCYAYEDGHVAGVANLRVLSDHKGDDLVRRVLALVDELRPIHVSLVGGDPLVRFRELEQLLPKLADRNIHVQLVTSAFRPIPASWSGLKGLNVVVSIDGLQPEHDLRRKPATYDRILRHIAGSRVTIHCTITSAMVRRERYLEEFLAFWCPRSEIKCVWMSMFTPQVGHDDVEVLSGKERGTVIRELHRLRLVFPKLDMPSAVLREFAMPPKSPKECIFAQTTLCLSADLQTQITPCQLGGNPDCSRCGCLASMGLAALGNHKVAPGISAGSLFRLSSSIGGLARHNLSLNIRRT
jgi:MoaA/NifB/PqqE/SkfB family radical SAM enzyme